MFTLPLVFDFLALGFFSKVMGRVQGVLVVNTLKELVPQVFRFSAAPSPGVSMMLMLWSFHMVYVAADWIVMPLCLSSSIESMVAPTPSFPFTYTPQTEDMTATCSHHLEENMTLRDKAQPVQLTSWISAILPV